MATFYFTNDSYELQHHGILGMKWGVKNGPPYPLDASSHSKREKKAGWRKSLNGGNTESKENKKRKFTFDKKKALKVGLAVAGTIAVGAIAYQTVNSLKNKNVKCGAEEVAKMLLDTQEQNVLKDTSEEFRKKAMEISKETKLPLKENLGTPMDDINTIISQRTGNSNTDCPYLLAAFVLRRKGLDVSTIDNQLGYEGGMSVGDLAHYFKGLNGRANSGSISTKGKTVQEVRELVLNKINEQMHGDLNGCGGIELSISNDGSSVGHFTEFYVENGKIKSYDIQSEIGNYLNKINYTACVNVRVMRMDDLEINSRNVLGNPNDISIKPIVKSAIINENKRG